MIPRQEEQELIREFGKEMQKKLDVRSSKGRLGWRKKNIMYLFSLFKVEVQELETALLHENDESIKNELVDCANYNMMIHDLISRDR